LNRLFSQMKVRRRAVFLARVHMRAHVRGVALWDSSS
jgi:hypothetical protein